MKRIIYVAVAFGLTWAAPAFSEGASSKPADPADPAHVAVRHALTDGATTSPSPAAGASDKLTTNKKDGKDKKDADKKTADSEGEGRRGDKKGAAGAASSTATADAAKHADKANHEATRAAHDRAAAHAGIDGNAAHVDAANRAAMHHADGARDKAGMEAHDAAGQMRTRVEHGDTRGMAEHGEGGEGGGTTGVGEGSGWRR